MVIQQYQTTNEGLPYIGVNRVPLGFAYYVTSVADNIASGTYGNGVSLELTQQNNVVDFQLLQHWYIVGASGTFYNCTKDDKLDAYLIAPKTLATQGVYGNYVKYNVAQGINMYVPVQQGSGDWHLDLNEKLPNTNILKCVPVPAKNDNGFFDYDFESNTLQVNLNKNGKFNLFDCDLMLFRFANRLHGRSIDGSSVAFIAQDTVGKLIYNFYKIRFSLTTQNQNAWVGIEMHTYVRGNV